MPLDSSTPRFTVSDFLAVLNQTLDYAFPEIELEGEVSSYKVSKGKWVFFDLKDTSGTISCFSTVYTLRSPITDGMRVVVSGAPKLTDFGKFSFTVRRLQPLGEGNITKSFDLLKAKLEKEGLFDSARKRPIPTDLQTLGVISSTTAAGYLDFIKIVNARWGGMSLKVANCGVQGLQAADEIIRAIDFFNEHQPVDTIVILRGGGSKDDLAVFNDELLTRKIAASKIPIVTGIGHEVDVSLADLAADLRASTPSNAAELLTRDKAAELLRLRDSFRSLDQYLSHYLSTLTDTHRSAIDSVHRELIARLSAVSSDLATKRQVLDSLNPEAVLRQGYAILSGHLSPGSDISIKTYQQIIKATITHVTPR